MKRALVAGVLAAALMPLSAFASYLGPGQTYLPYSQMYSPYNAGSYYQPSYYGYNSYNSYNTMPMNYYGNYGYYQQPMYYSMPQMMGPSVYVNVAPQLNGWGGWGGWY